MHVAFELVGKRTEVEWTDCKVGRLIKRGKLFSNAVVTCEI